MTRGESAKGAAGFTLLELLVAMTLLGLLTVLLFGGLKFGARAWARGEAHSAGAEEVRFVQQLLRRELEESYPFFLATDPLDPHVTFEGETQSLTFLAPAPQSLGVAGRARITLRAVAGEGGEKLVILARPELAFGDDASAEVLIDGLEALSFSYYGAEGASDPPQWHDRWSDRRDFPKLIRVAARFPAGDARRWPDLVVAPRIDVDLGCGYDPLSKSCRGR
ncbi:MAG TPA: prepilin-type N-terminal cleavage/methylation domain-containing protein [Stellaceae bacterium]|nr:prepilin-type N-terminal cleavage/methylation domain-containing protein [Stellaceae bacterium]